MKPAYTARLLSTLVFLGAQVVLAQPAPPATPITPPLPHGANTNAPLPRVQPAQPRRVTAPVRVTPRTVPTSPNVIVTPAVPTIPAGQLVFDAASKTETAKAGELNIPFTFNVTNSSDVMVTINSVRTSCGCTAAQMPEMPWHLPPGGSGAFGVNMNVAGKLGTITKTVTIFSTAGITNLLVTVEVPADEPDSPQMMDRLRNQRIAAADRQAIFKGDCASCHATPAVGKMGAELFDTACGICHEAEHRASMVPDLRKAPQDATSEYWREFVTHGKPGTLMPAFAQSEQGPLTEEQIDSLVDYLTFNFDQRKQDSSVKSADSTSPNTGHGH